MKKTLKKIIVAILGAALLLSSTALMFSCKNGEEDKIPSTQPPYVEQVPEVIVGELVYQLVKDDYADENAVEYYTVIGVVGSSANKVVIPTEVNGKPVKAISDGAFYGNGKITAVEIPSSVDNIGERALAGCSSLVSIEVSSESEAFKSIDGSLYTADGAVLVQYAIGKGESEFTVPDDVIEIGAYAFNNARITTLTLSPALGKIGDFAFSGMPIESIDIPADVSEIASNAFNHCAKLSSINVSADNSGYKSVDGNLYTKGEAQTLVRYAPAKTDRSFSVASGTEIIASNAFLGAAALESISLSASLVTIEDYAFSGCSSLTALNITSSVTSIAPTAFDGCVSLSSFTVNSNNQSYAASSGILFNKDKKTLIKYPNAKSGTKYEVATMVEKIGAYAFSGSLNLTTIQLTNKIENIGIGAFDDCANLKYNTSSGVNYLGTSSNQYYALVSLSDSAKDTLKSVEAKSNTYLIAGGAFANNSVLESVTFSSSIKYVSSDAFSYCSALKIVDFKKATKIFTAAISHCPALEAIVLPDTLKLIDENVIVDCPALKVIYYNIASAEDWEALKSALTPLVEGKQDSVNYNSAIRYYYSASAPMELGNHWRYVSGKPTVWTIQGELSESEGLAMTLSSDRTYYTVTGMGYFSGTDLVIPTEYEGKPVKAIAGGAFLGERIKSLVIPYTVEFIGANAFTDCAQLASASLGNSVSYIGVGAFKNCTKLVSVDIPDGVTFIEAESFLGCTALSSVDIPEGLKSIGASAFADCSNLNGIVLPYGAISIAEEAFAGCTKLSSATLSETVTEIGKRAFASTALAEIKIPANVIYISDSAFNGCQTLRKISVDEANEVYASVNGVLYGKDDSGNKVTLLCCPEGYIYPKNSPSDKSSNTTLTIPGTVTSIQSYAADNCKYLNSIEFENSAIIEFIGDYAFAYCESLLGISVMSEGTGPAEPKIPASIQSIGKYAFTGTSLTNLVISDGANAVIKEGAFQNCASLVTVELPEGITSIGWNAFYGCQALMSVTIPNSVTELGNLAFFGCTKLTSATLGNGITSIPGSLFAECMSLESLTIGNAVTEIAPSALDGCISLKNITVAYENTAYVAHGGILYTADESTLVRYPAAIDNATFEIPASVTAIADYAFALSHIESIVIPDTVASIGNYAFNNCKALTSVTIGAGVQSIGKGAFESCGLLSSLKILDGADITVGDEAFSACASLEELVLPDRVTEIGNGAFKECRLIESVKLGEGVKTIGSEAFYNAYSIKWIVVGSSVELIGENAFAGCASLASVYYMLDNVAFRAIQVENGNTALTSALLYCYSATDPQTSVIYWHYDASGNIVFW